MKLFEKVSEGFSKGNLLCYFLIKKWENCHGTLSVLEKIGHYKKVLFAQGFLKFIFFLNFFNMFSEI